MPQCLTCGSDTGNPKFCSRSCAAKYTNQHFPRRKSSVYICLTCGTQTSNRRKYCDIHQPNARKTYELTSIGEIRRQAKYQAHALVRRLARRTYKTSGSPNQCYICGYSTHVEICHIHAIQTFSDNVSITQINSQDNLVALCPNHHWEFDHGLLTL